MVAKFKRSGQKKPEESYPIIENADMNKIRNYFDRKTAKNLQYEVIFNLLFFFGLRGRETLPHLTKESIICETSSTGKKYLRICHDILSKNAKASLDPKEFEDLKKARIYENTDDKSKCPVEAWNLYFESISDLIHLFPKPSNLKSKRSAKWYTPTQKLGKNKLDCFMSNSSKN